MKSTETEALNNYYLGKLHSEGIEYFGDSAHEYWMGRHDSIFNGQSLELNCGPGSKRCGDACIPKKKKCRASWNKPVKLVGGAAALAGAGVIGTALFHPRPKMRKAASAIINPVTQTGFALGNIVRGNVPGAANNAVNAAATAESFGENAKSVARGYGEDIKKSYKKLKGRVNKKRRGSGLRSITNNLPFGR